MAFWKSGGKESFSVILQSSWRGEKAVPDEPYSCSYVLRMVLSKNWQKYHQFGKNWNNFGDFSDNSAVLHVTTKLVTEQCKLNMQYCMIHHINQNCSADAKMYHTWLYVKCTMIYDHKCTRFWRSVSASAALTPAVRVRIRPPQRSSLPKALRLVY